MRKWARRVMVLVAAVACVLSVQLPVDATKLEGFHLLATGVAEVSASTCPMDAEPAPQTQCVGTHVLYFQEAAPRDHPRRQPWTVFVFEERFLFRSADEPIVLLHERFGVLENASGFVDTRHFLSAAVDASIPMDDGSIYEVDLTWDMSGVPLRTAGNDGPLQDDGPFPGGHLVDECVTANSHAHQRWRWQGQITGSLDGVAIETMFLTPDSPFVGSGVFTLNVSAHGPRCL